MVFSITLLFVTLDQQLTSMQPQPSMYQETELEQARLALKEEEEEIDETGYPREEQQCCLTCCCKKTFTYCYGTYQCCKYTYGLLKQCFQCCKGTTCCCLWTCEKTTKCCASIGVCCTKALQDCYEFLRYLCEDSD